MDDSQIIRLYFERSETAIAETDKKYGAFLNQVAYNILRGAEDTEEIVNDTYLGAWNAIPPAKPERLKYFLSRIARNLAINRLDYLQAKRRASMAQQLLSELDECIPDRNGSAEDVWEEKEIGASLNRFLSTLDKTDCLVFVSRYFYSLSCKEIAGRTSLSERKIKYLLFKLRGKLKTHLEKDGVII